MSTQTWTYSHYGCRCDACRTANNQAQREWRARRRSGEPAPDRRRTGRTHGTRSCYRNGCRCDACRARERDHMRAYRARRAEVAA